MIQSAHTASFSTANLSTGVYFGQLVFNDGSTSGTKLFLR
ncbi:MAG: hypothetical protein ACI9P8_001108 [Bacteroidia bacterium]